MALSRRCAAALCAAGLVVVAAAAVAAVDPWETAGVFGTDDTSASRNTLSHGAVQQHDLDQAGGGPDQDWMIVPTIAGHSYEARIHSMVRFDFGACATCAQFERVSSAGAILTGDVSTVNEGPGAGQEAYDRSIRWVATQPTVSEFVRVIGDTDFTNGPNAVYTIRYWDTTYSVPRWNNANGQITVFFINSMIQASASVRVDFYNATGTLLSTSNATLEPNRLLTINTGAIPALAGQSGHAYIAHTAGYGGLAGKAVALEPATGFSFDTPIVAIPD
jgi:hypothetical protein